MLWSPARLLNTRSLHKHEIRQINIINSWCKFIPTKLRRWKFIQNLHNEKFHSFRSRHGWRDLGGHRKLYSEIRNTYAYTSVDIKAGLKRIRMEGDVYCCTIYKPAVHKQNEFRKVQRGLPTTRQIPLKGMRCRQILKVSTTKWVLFGQ
jgi:hypothetical protein